MAKQNKVEKEIPPQYSHVLLNIYQLLSYSISSKKIARMACEKGFVWLHLMQEMHEVSEVKHLLITIATNIRIGRDYQRIHYSANRDISAVEVGKLVEAGKKEPLTLLEACNKIIHATKFTFDESETKRAANAPSHNLKCPYLKPFVHLYGSRWNKSKGKDVAWKATINIETFAKNAAVASVGYMWQFKRKD